MGDIVMISKTTRRLAPAIVLAASAATAAPAASAVSTFAVSAKDSCVKFGLTIESSDGDIRVNRYIDRNGKPVRHITVRTGVVLTYINARTGKSISFKTSGSVSSTVTNADGTQTVTLTGHNGLIMFRVDDPGPSAIQYTGRVVFTIDTQGIFHLVSTSNPEVDICAAVR